MIEIPIRITNNGPNFSVDGDSYWKYYYENKLEIALG